MTPFVTAKTQRLPGFYGAVVEALEIEGLMQDAVACRRAYWARQRANLSERGGKVVLSIMRNSGKYSTGAA